VDEAAGQLHPMTKDLTSGVVRPGGEALSKNAVPVTKDIAENRVQPAVEQVIPFCCVSADPSMSQHKRVHSTRGPCSAMNATSASYKGCSTLVLSLRPLSRDHRLLTCAAVPSRL